MHTSMKSICIVLLMMMAVHACAQMPVILKENFSENIYGWIERETDEHKVAFRNGKYFMKAPPGGWMSYLSPYIEPRKDFSVEATFTQVDGKDDNGIGFVWGYDGKEALNSFTFTSNGYYRIWC